MIIGCIEYDGKFWHKNRIEQDKERDTKLLKIGWKTIRISELKRNSKINEVIEKIKNFYMGSHVPLGARLPCKQSVEGSTPFGSTCIHTK